MGQRGLLWQRQKTKLSCDWSSLEFWNDACSLFIYNWSDQTQVCIPGGIPVTWDPTFSLVGQKPRLDYSPPGLGFGRPRTKQVTFQHKQWLHHLFRRVLLRDERHLKVGAYQLSPKVILAVLSTHAFLHKVHLVNDDLTWWQICEITKW